MGTLSYIKEIWYGKDTYRILMNEECGTHTLRGKVFDLGSGKNLASYHRFFKKAENTKIVSFDLIINQIEQKVTEQIDFEKDALPVDDNSVDIILIFNLLEHIYDNSIFIKEIKRVLKDGGEVIGSVPFLVGYHADPHDYWRFTSESLERIFSQYGFFNIKIKIIGEGPITAAFSQIEFILPRLVKMLVVPVFFLLDKLLFLFKPKLHREKFALGLFFSLKK